MKLFDTLAKYQKNINLKTCNRYFITSELFIIQYDKIKIIKNAVAYSLLEIEVKNVSMM